MKITNRVGAINSLGKGQECVWRSDMDLAGY